ncbi:MAG: helix-turn-helix domain-containing protein [Hyphomicrobiales bacterium]
MEKLKSKPKTKSAKGSAFSLALRESLGEIVAWKRGEIELPVRTVVAMSSERVRDIRKSVAKSPREFEARFGIPARTIEGWEQGRRQPDPTACLLLRVIEKNPELVEAAISDK